jgi:hypothetical protein
LSSRKNVSPQRHRGHREDASSLAGDAAKEKAFCLFKTEGLDLGRVGITPRTEKLCTEEARDPGLLKWAVQRSEELFVPSLVSSEWGIRFSGHKS